MPRHPPAWGYIVEYSAATVEGTGRTTLERIAVSYARRQAAEEGWTLHGLPDSVSWMPMRSYVVPDGLALFPCAEASADWWRLYLRWATDVSVRSDALGLDEYEDA